MRTGNKFRLILIGALMILTGLTACSSRLGWGVLLWSTEDPPIPSGTVLPVYIRSNINKVWVVGIPDNYLDKKNRINKMEIPLSRFELAGSKAKAHKRAEAFSRYAHTYAENMQDGLPIRDNPDNNARRIYRLRTGEIIKVLSLAKGVPAISTTGDPLPGDWYRVLTEDGSIGYCFSYRLKLFEHNGGPITASAAAGPENSAGPDPDLDMLLSKTWSPELYFTMVNYKRINLEELSHYWRFDPGQETGIARIYAPGYDLNFSYNAIRPEGQRAWRFEGSNLHMQMRSDTTIAVQFSEGGGGMKTLLFVALPTAVDDLIIQESARRERLYDVIFSQGPVFTSNNYGTIAFNENGSFAWRGFDLLVPRFIPESAEGDGTVSMDLFLDPAFEDRYSGAFTLHFTENGARETAVLRCMYALDNQGFRIEVAPESTIEDSTVVRRAASPMVLYFFKDALLW
ncbi:MAG: SH3 domain-containing protein [Treponema sp.]|nr:SH3 domain-containing protein [Treponema sp.]